jgi:hypothetical protein
MPTYHFDYRDNGTLACDHLGTRLHSFEEAKVEAVRALVELARDEIQGPEPRELAIEVREDGGPILQVVLTLEVKQLT